MRFHECGLLAHCCRLRCHERGGRMQAFHDYDEYLCLLSLQTFMFGRKVFVFSPRLLVLKRVFSNTKKGLAHYMRKRAFFKPSVKTGAAPDIGRVLISRVLRSPPATWKRRRCEQLRWLVLCRPPGKDGLQASKDARPQCRVCGSIVVHRLLRTRPEEGRVFALPGSDWL